MCALAYVYLSVLGYHVSERRHGGCPRSLCRVQPASRASSRTVTELNLFANTDTANRYPTFAAEPTRNERGNEREKPEIPNKSEISNEGKNRV